MPHVHASIRSCGFLVSGLACVALLPAAAQAQLTPDEVRTQIGWFDLEQRLGAGAVPTGAGVSILQCEAPEAANEWMPNTNAASGAHFQGKVFNIPFGSPAVSSHATSVAKLCYGNLDSIAPGVSDIWLYETGTFLTSGYLKTGQSGVLPSEPPSESIRIMNHSWIGEFGNTSDTNALNRLDYLINRDNLLSLNGRGNAGDPDVRLLALSFNSITVGAAQGNDLTTDTPTGFDGPGRMKPDLVAPGEFTSFTTPVVSATAAVLYETIATDPVLSEDSLISSRQPIMKAILLAGASRDEAWTNQPVDGVTSRPIDEEQGAGVVNVDRSHQILTGYRHSSASSLESAPIIPRSGFDYPRPTPGQTRWWRFSANRTLDEVSVALTWPRLPSTSFASYSLMDLDLELVRIVDGQPQPIAASDGLFASGNVLSTSQVDNVELLSIRGLQPGDYALRVTRMNSGSTAFSGLAWLMIEAEGIPGDYDGNGAVNGNDLAQLLSAWGTNDPEFDLTGDGLIGGADLAKLLSNWG